jgi:hypothetical protein
MKTLIRVLGFVLLFGPLPCVLAQIATPIHGVTVADDYDIRITKYLNQVLPALTGLSVTPSVRAVFTLEVDSGQQGATASTMHQRSSKSRPAW